MGETLTQRLEIIRNQIARAAEKANRNPGEIKLVAVSKTHPAAKIREAIEAGGRVFGENKVQEAEGKIAEIGRENAEWHLIGHLQSNKARKAVRLFDVIHSLDSRELAERLERICVEENREKLSVFGQVDLGRETTKNGIEEKDLPALVEFLRRAKHLKFDGLMVVPPFFEDSEKVRPFFRRLREIRDAVCPQGELSMGMSHDFTVAIEEGATVIRVGTAIFGERGYQN
ncbi:MAG TPA: YggS family pyridoxal phosphate-dependent enzyme [Pyrinomonadaceae bacterium]|jgi:pyridoxal phosphate enzyme (YggS family)